MYRRPPCTPSRHLNGRPEACVSPGKCQRSGPECGEHATDQPSFGGSNICAVVEGGRTLTRKEANCRTHERSWASFQRHSPAEKSNSKNNKQKAHRRRIQFTKPLRCEPRATERWLPLRALAELGKRPPPLPALQGGAARATPTGARLARPLRQYRRRRNCPGARWQDTSS